MVPFSGHNGHQMVSVLTMPDIIAEFYSYSVKQNGHQMVPVLTIIADSTIVV